MSKLYKKVWNKPVGDLSINSLDLLLHQEQADELDIPRQPTNIELINDKYRMPDSYTLKLMYPSKNLREHFNQEGNLSDKEKYLLFLSPMIPYIAVWLLVGYIALYGI
tara:strand:- start:5 stop:328 length:324 start_codon:yes stop_codon:yes gene_type:complete